MRTLRKRRGLNNKFLNIVKSSSVDCSLNYAQNHLVDKRLCVLCPRPFQNTRKSVMVLGFAAGFKQIRRR